MLFYHLIRVHKPGVQVKDGQRHVVSPGLDRNFKVAGGRREDIERESRGVEIPGFDCATHLLCACVCVFSRPLPLGKVAQLSTLPVSPSIHVSCCCTLCNPLTEETFSSSVMPFPSRHHCAYCSTTPVLTPKPSLSTATRSHTPLSNPALFSYFLGHTSNAVLTPTPSLRKPHTATSAHFILLSLTC